MMHMKLMAIYYLTVPTILDGHVTKLIDSLGIPLFSLDSEYNAPDLGGLSPTFTPW